MNKISYIEAKDVFLFPNFIYSILHQELINQYLNQNCNELLSEEEKEKKTSEKKSKKIRKREIKKNKLIQKNKKIIIMTIIIAIL